MKSQMDINRYHKYRAENVRFDISMNINNFICTKFRMDYIERPEFST